MATKTTLGQFPAPRTGREFLSPYEDYPGLPASLVPYWNMLLWKEDVVAALEPPDEGPRYAANVIEAAHRELEEARTAYAGQLALHAEIPALAA
jgi:hypothetical protein